MGKIADRAPCRAGLRRRAIQFYAIRTSAGAAQTPATGAPSDPPPTPVITPLRTIVAPRPPAGMERRGEEAEPPSYDDTVMEAAAELQEPPPAEAPGSPGSPAEGGPDGARRLPRSHASICFALDQMDQELEAEEVEMEAERAGEAARRTAAAHECTSHPLSFLAQYPRLAIVTTAALPWLTGTAVNPALRAAYLWRRGHAVALVVPWLPPPAQPRLFPDGMVFQTPGEQEAAMMAAIQARVPFPVPSPAAPDPSFQIVFYPGRYDPALGSIMPDGDIQPLIPRPVSAPAASSSQQKHARWEAAARCC
jgi:hypothetical protein